MYSRRSAPSITETQRRRSGRRTRPRAGFEVVHRALPRQRREPLDDRRVGARRRRGDARGALTVCTCGRGTRSCHTPATRVWAKAPRAASRPVRVNGDGRADVTVAHPESDCVAVLQAAATLASTKWSARAYRQPCKWSIARGSLNISVSRCPLERDIAPSCIISTQFNRFARARAEPDRRPLLKTPCCFAIQAAWNSANGRA